MTHHDLIHGKGEPGREHPSGAEMRSANNGGSYAGDEYTFRAPRFGDLVACPYCDADTFTCDHCGGERRLYASEVFQ